MFSLEIFYWLWSHWVFQSGIFFSITFVLIRAPRVTVFLEYSFKQTKLLSSVALLYNM